MNEFPNGLSINYKAAELVKKTETQILVVPSKPNGDFKLCPKDDLKPLKDFKEENARIQVF